MRPLFAAFALFLVARPAVAQGILIRGFAGGAATSSVDREWYTGAGGGVLVDPGTPWVSVGAQGEALISWPYFAGRGAVFGQFNAAPHSTVRPFVLAGAGFGEEGGPLLGGGVEFRVPGSRRGFRVSVEDYVDRYIRYSPGEMQPVKTTGHQVALRAAVLF